MIFQSIEAERVILIENVSIFIFNLIKPDYL